MAAASTKKPAGPKSAQGPAKSSKAAEAPASKASKAAPASSAKDAQKGAERAVLPAIRLGAEHRAFIDAAAAGKSKAVASLQAKNRDAGPLDKEVRVGLTPDEANALLTLMKRMAEKAEDRRSKSVAVAKVRFLEKVKAGKAKFRHWVDAETGKPVKAAK